MIQQVAITRQFKFGAIVLPDPSEAMSPTAVKDFYSSQYPALTNAQLKTGGIENDQQVIEFVGKVGVKG